MKRKHDSNENDEKMKIAKLPHVACKDPAASKEETWQLIKPFFVAKFKNHAFFQDVPYEIIKEIKGHVKNNVMKDGHQRCKSAKALLDNTLKLLHASGSVVDSIKEVNEKIEAMDKKTKNPYNFRLCFSQSDNQDEIIIHYPSLFQNCTYSSQDSKKISFNKSCFLTQAKIKILSDNKGDFYFELSGGQVKLYSACDFVKFMDGPFLDMLIDDFKQENSSNFTPSF